MHACLCLYYLLAHLPLCANSIVCFYVPLLVIILKKEIELLALEVSKFSVIVPWIGYWSCKQIELAFGHGVSLTTL